MQAVECGSPRIGELRALLAEKFPRSEPKSGGVFCVPMEGSPALELRRGAITEVCGSLGSSALFLEGLIRAARGEGMMVALVDGSGSFDPAQCGAPVGHLLWVICRDARAAVKSADLLLRDGNIPLVLLDLQMTPDAERVPATTWYRFQRIVEPAASALLVFTSRPLVGSAAERVELRHRWTLEAMRRRRTELRIAAELVRRRAREISERRIA